MSSIADKEFYNLTISINKALNSNEAPLKIKHARSIIITTHRTKEAKSFWTIITRQPIMENRFTAWKFCHLVHKVLREGHVSTIKQSQLHKKMILEVGKLWGHLQDGVGNCIQAYTKLIVTKLDFHEKNSIFCGSMIIDFREITSFAGDDINIYFQLCVEIFDYLDDIIDVQLKVFSSINTYRMSSMTPQGQCRLAPLITLIQDSNPLYDTCVRIMFKLHDDLPNDILSGHRDRFGELFSKLKLFYENVRPLQYFADLIQVPYLPDVAPNFTSKVDFGSYIPPVVYVQPDPEPVMENLVDTSLLPEHQEDAVISIENAIQERENTIKELQRELADFKECISSLENNHKKEVNHLRNEIALLSNELTYCKEINAKMRLLKDDLEIKLSNAPALLQKSSEVEEKAKASEQKFSKLKNMYAQIRDEHINLLRQHGDLTKNYNKEKQISSDLNLEILNLKERYTDCLNEVKEKDEICQQNACLDEELQELSAKYKLLLAANVELKRKFENNSSEKCIEIEKLTLKAEQFERDLVELLECKAKITCLEATLTKASDALNKTKIDQEKELNQYENDLKNKSKEIIEIEKVYENIISNLNCEIKALQDVIKAAESKTNEKDLSLNRLTDDKLLLESELQDLLQQNLDLENKLKLALLKCEETSITERQNKILYESVICSTLHSVWKTMKFIVASKNNNTNQNFVEKSIYFLNEVEKLTCEISIVYEIYCKDKSCVEGLARKTILLGYNFTMLHEQCLLIYSNTTDMEMGTDVYNKIHSTGDMLLNLYEFLHNMEGKTSIDDILTEIKLKLTEIRNLISKLMKEFETKVDLGDLVENELEVMDNTIKDATERFIQLLSHARRKDNGIKLEVNEKILDACTSLMECIKLLIKKSRILQEEIITTKGCTSAKEFYKRNSQWTEGLISASKSVAKGANLLVDSANKAVTTESNNHFEIIVAAQEIAAYTAQLVIASKVKASRESIKLADLTKASKSVSQATGVVVATVRDCNQYLEQPQEIDLSKLTTSQAKAMEMGIHVRILELEHSLQTERLKLTSFRRNNYQNTED